MGTHPNNTAIFSQASVNKNKTNPIVMKKHVAATKAGGMRIARGTRKSLAATNDASNKNKSNNPNQMLDTEIEDEDLIRQQRQPQMKLRPNIPPAAQNKPASPKHSKNSYRNPRNAQINSNVNQPRLITH